MSDGADITLLPADEADIWDVLAWRNQPHVRDNMYTADPISRDTHEAWFSAALADPARELWIIAVNGTKCGLVTLTDIVRTPPSSCSWAFYIGDLGVVGKGVGSAVETQVLDRVFATLKLDVLRCEVLAFNAPVIGLHKKFGFEQSGRIENRITRDGDGIDAICLELTRERWRARQEA
ncbi:UDP-4-amino-4,6-dideoxy-N-acetyl-beta-L-altrosamine N-acetyltransferase [Maricaulis sp.]|uniref:UDP-4-amino-4, 6-dideoxy-N-acetyl-beta-L-altrosamine N-acetyltransferase n=1 Tax=Maricaulis sp. TaxID=1486257 RepID=UPI0026373B14|nr:UDP-4-amino-4,6-dideoxy-N-acetyl-beta-L-altrosamine N-acetyltransferase [Maricaulis sp.]